MRVSKIQNSYTNPYKQKNIGVKNAQINCANPAFRGNYETYFIEAISKKFTNGEQAVTLMENMLRAAAKESSIKDVYMYYRLLDSGLAVSRLRDCIEYAIRIQRDYEPVPVTSNHLVYYFLDAIVFKHPSEIKREVRFSTHEKNTSRLYVEQNCDCQIYNKYTFYHAKGLPLKQHTSISGSGPYSTVSETEKYNLDGSPETVGDKIKNFFGF